MKPYEFIEIYSQLSIEQKEALDEAIQLRDEKLEDISQLEEKLQNLTPAQTQDLERDAAEYQKRMESELRALDQAVYSIDDPEEAMSLREMDAANLSDEHYEVLTTTFPIGIEILQTEIEQIEEEMAKLISPFPRNRTS